MRDLTYAQSRRPSAEDLRRPAPQLQVPLVVRPRNRISSLLAVRCDRFVTDAQAE